MSARFWGSFFRQRKAEGTNTPSFDVEANDEERSDRGELARDEAARAGEVHVQRVGVHSHGG